MAMENSTVAPPWYHRGDLMALENSTMEFSRAPGLPPWNFPGPSWCHGGASMAIENFIVVNRLRVRASEVFPRMSGELEK